jgi:sulfopyruvate decarboxylase subunit alpha
MAAAERQQARAVAPLRWQQTIAEAMRSAGIGAVAYVPDARLRGILAVLEEECIAYAAGFVAAGGRAAVLMQCSGLGNSLNALGSFVIPYGLGIPLVLSMRGTLGERNPSQVPMGRATVQLLNALGIQSFSLADEERTQTVVNGVLELAFSTGAPAAMILEPELGGQREGG